MKAALKRLIGADRQKVIAVVGLTRDDVEVGVAHAATAAHPYPVRTWCAEDCTAFQMRRELRSVWPALTLVSWTGRRGDVAFKLLPLTVPPFRVVVFNESRGFFPARPLPVARHFGQRLADILMSAAQLAYSLLYRTGQRVRDVIRLVWSLLYRFVFQKTVDVARLVWSLLYRAGERLYSYFLAVLAFLAQATPAMARSAYRGMAAGTATAVAIASPSGRTGTEIAVSGRAWPRRAVRRASSDFLVFRRIGETAPAEPLIELAVERNAFAAARQLAWTGWRARVATRHPFRRLLPGEVTRTEMPFSSLIVVRRDLAVSLGIPRALTFGAALMILFRKAASAGWPSYVAGHADAITQEPAMPLEDAEFVARVCRSVRYDSPLVRGNIFSAPAYAKPFRGLPRVLIVSPYLPFPLSHGGAVRIYNICRALAGEVDFVLVCFREVTETVRYPELHEVFREVYTVDIDEKGADPAVPKQVVDYRNTAMAALIREQARQADVVQLEYTQMAEYRACAEGRPTILVEHDITFTLYQQLGRDYDIWERFESEALRSVSAVWTMSERDRELAIEHGASRGTSLAVPNGVDLVRFRPVARETEGHAVLFVGSFRHLPNLLAYEALRQTIMPAVWSHFPECRLRVIAGPDHEKWARLASKGKLLGSDPRISIQGFVEDVRPAYRECDVVAIPLPVSAGTNIKLMEAMACGRAIVSTGVGCQGLDLDDGSDLLVAEVGPDFAEAIRVLLADGDRRERMAQRARKTAEERFDWYRIAREAMTCYERLKETP